LGSTRNDEGPALSGIAIHVAGSLVMTLLGIGTVALLLYSQLAVA
jgi:hypothetical protein